MSIGAAVCRNELSGDHLMKLADEALYQAKEAGRDTFRLLSRGFDGNGDGNGKSRGNVHPHGSSHDEPVPLRKA